MKIKNGLVLAGVILAFVVLAGFAGRMTMVASEMEWNGFDGTLFVSQAFRLVDSQFSPLGFDPSRPRALVGLLAGFSFLTKLITDVLPSLPVLHLFMLSLSVLFLILTYQFIARTLSPITGTLVVLFLALQPAFVEQSTFCLADILSGLLLLVLFYYAERTVLNRRTDSLRPWVILGFLGALVGMGKYTLLPFFPLFGFAFWVIGQWEKKTAYPDALSVSARQMGVGLFTFVLTLDLGHRLLGTWDSGLWSDVTEALHLSFVFPGLGGESAHRVSMDPWSFYFKNLWVSQGKVFWISTFVISLGWLISRKTPVKWKTSYRAPILYFGLSGLFILLHIVITHKEDRYLLPFYPAIFGLVALPFAHFLESSPRRPVQAGVAFLIFIMLLAPESNSRDVIRSIDQISRSSEPAEFASLLDYLKSPPLTHRPCQKIYGCEVSRSFLKLDAPIFKAHLPTAEVFTPFCNQAKFNLNELRPYLMNQVIDDIDLQTCFLEGKSVVAANEKNSLRIHIPIKLGMLRREVAALEKSVFKDYEGINCARGAGDRDHFDCYLTKSFFAGPSAPPNSLDLVVD